MGVHCTLEPSLQPLGSPYVSNVFNPYSCACRFFSWGVTGFSLFLFIKIPIYFRFVLFLIFFVWYFLVFLMFSPLSFVQPTIFQILVFCLSHGFSFLFLLAGDFIGLFNCYQLLFHICQFLFFIPISLPP